MSELKIKVCGMRHSANVSEIAGLKPDFMGFILYEKSPRYVKSTMLPEILDLVPSGIKKIGVLVNEPLESAVRLADSGMFDLLQLHGDETPEYCNMLSGHALLIKAFRLSGSLPDKIKEYLPYCQFFLFDTAGAGYGGNGQKFDHKILKDYNFDKDYLLGGGISPSDVDNIRGLKLSRMAGIDLNSRFEISAGLKDAGLVKEFIEKIRYK